VRIVFLNPSGRLGGAETALVEMLAALRQARHSWNLNVIASAPGPLVDRMSELGIPSASLTFPTSLARLGEWGRRGSMIARIQLAVAALRALLPVLAYAARLRRHIGAIDPDVVHTNGLKMHLLGAWCRPRRAKLLWHMHDYPDSRPLTSWLLRAGRRRCTATIANSESVAERARLMLGPTIPVHVVHNAVDLDRFHPSGSRLDLDALAGLPPLEPGGIRIGLVGTFARWKGHDVFLRALSRVRSSVPIRGYVIGGPIYETDNSQFSMDELRTLAGVAGLDHVIGFTGPVSDVPAALRALDIVVHASTEPEPFGLVIAEAMACGRPLVASKAGGAEEIAPEGAVFHQPGDADDLASCLSQLASSPALRDGLGAAGREAATRLFSRRRLASVLVPIYESL
jgi:glycosyltransferase involved in cell wall biosynthesis